MKSSSCFAIRRVDIRMWERDTSRCNQRHHQPMFPTTNHWFQLPCELIAIRCTGRQLHENRLPKRLLLDKWNRELLFRDRSLSWYHLCLLEIWRDFQLATSITIQFKNVLGKLIKNCATHVTVWRNSEDSIVLMEICEIQLWHWFQLRIIITHWGHMLKDVVQRHFQIFFTLIRWDI